MNSDAAGIFTKKSNAYSKVPLNDDEFSILVFDKGPAVGIPVSGGYGEHAGSYVPPITGSCVEVRARANMVPDQFNNMNNDSTVSHSKGCSCSGCDGCQMPPICRLVAAALVFALSFGVWWTVVGHQLITPSQFYMCGAEGGSGDYSNVGGRKLLRTIHHNTHHYYPNHYINGGGTSSGAEKCEEGETGCLLPEWKLFCAAQVAGGGCDRCFIAIGQSATGVIAVGQMAVGVVAFGQLAFGVFGIGGMVGWGVMAWGFGIGGSAGYTSAGIFGLWNKFGYALFGGNQDKQICTA